MITRDLLYIFVLAVTNLQTWGLNPLSMPSRDWNSWALPLIKSSIYQTMRTYFQKIQRARGNTKENLISARHPAC